MQHYPLAQAVKNGAILLLIVIELTRNKQSQRAILYPLKRLQEQVQTLIVAYEPEEEEIPLIGIDTQLPTRLRAFYALAEVFEHRVWREDGRSRGVTPQLSTHLLRHIDKAINRTEIVAIERFVYEMVFVWFDIIDLADDLRLAIFAGNTGNRTEARSHKRSPILHQNHIGSLPA